MLLGLPQKIQASFAKRMIDPADIVRQLGVSSGWRVLELGVPVGFFAPALHAVIGDAGEMIIAAPTTEALEKLHDEIDHVHTKTTLLSHVLAGQAAADHSLDLIILTNVLSNTAHADNFCLSLARYLKPTGRIVVLDWDVEAESSFDKPNALSREQALHLLAKCGWSFERLLATPGYHFGFIFRASAVSNLVAGKGTGAPA